MDATELGRLIRFKRMQRGLTLDQLAAKIGFSGAHVSRIESGKLKREIEPFILERIAVALGTPIEEFGGQSLAVSADDQTADADTRGRADLWIQSFWRTERMIPVSERLDRLHAIDPLEAERFRAKLTNTAEDVIAVGEELRQVALLDESIEVKWWLEVGMTILELLKSDRRGIVCVDIFSLSYAKANTAVEPQVTKRVRALCKVIEDATLGYELLFDHRTKSLDHAWSFFWLLREMGNLSGTLAVFAGAWTTGSDQLLGFCRSFQAAETEFSGLDFPARPQWVRAYDSNVDRFVASKVAPASPDFLLRAATTVTRANDALALFADAEAWAQDYYNQLDPSGLSLNQAAKLARWEVDLANIKRDRIQFLAKLSQLDSQFGYSIRLSDSVHEDSLSECETQIRKAIRSLMDAIVSSSEDSGTARRTLASLHIELAFLLRIRGNFEQYKNAIWNHLIACSLDPRRLAAGNAFNASLGSTVTDRLRRKEFDAFAVELETRRTQTNFESFHYEF